MESLKEMLKDADTFKEALETLKGKDIVMEGGPDYRAWNMEVLDTKSDYFIALWKGNTTQREFFSKYDSNAFFSLKG